MNASRYEFNAVQLEQAHATEIRCQIDQSRKEDPYQKHLLLQAEVIILKMNKDQNSKDNNNDKENDHKPSVQEKKQANEKKKANEEDKIDNTTDSEKPPKKMR